MQIFVRDKAIFDTGVHYLGGLNEGQNLNQCFKYFNILKDLKLHKLDENGFDKISFDDDPIEYPHAQGHENFVEQLLPYFPKERVALETYMEKIKEVCDYFPLYQLKNTEAPVLDLKYLDISAKQYIDSLTQDEKLRNVLGGSNPLYAGEEDKTPLYVHALVMNTYIESAYKCVDGGSQIERYLTRGIKENGGILRNYAHVTKITEKSGKVTHVTLADGEQIEGKLFISNIHPAITMDILESTKIKKAFKSRLQNLQNCSSCFIVDVVLKPESFKYKNYNHYHYRKNEVWNGVYKYGEEWPAGYCMFVPKSSRSGEYAESLSVLCYMQIDELEKWSDTFATIPKFREGRGDEYEEFKERKAQIVLKEVYKKYPELKGSIQSYTCSTPLTYRDYIGSKNGSLYGIAKDYKDPLRTFISPTTKIPNLFFTGQNLSMHGVLGVTVGAIRTCGSIIGQKYLVDKINKA